MEPRATATAGLVLIALAVTVAVVLVPAGRTVDETPVLIGYLLYLIGPAGWVILVLGASEAMKVPRGWRYLLGIAAYPVGVVLTGTILINLGRLSH